MSLSFFSTALEQLYGQVSGKQKANEWYKLLIPELHEALERGTPMSDPQLSRLIEAITDLSPAGAKRSNFKRKYMSDKDSMMNLPRDPNMIPYGFWW